VADVVSVDDVALNKLAAIERCVRRIAEVYAGDDRNLRADLTRQDSIILNIQRAAESAIDLAMHLVRREKLGIPQDSRDAFSLLVQRSGLDPELGVRLQRMVGFRNLCPYILPARKQARKKHARLRSTGELLIQPRGDESAAGLGSTGAYTWAWARAARRRARLIARARLQLRE